MTELVLLLVGGVIILALAVTAGVLHWRLHQLRKAQRVAQEAEEVRLAEQRDGINRSIQIIARALEADQVGATEASIRISVLLDALQVQPATKEEFAAFYRLAEEASHIPILDAWKALPKNERTAYERELAVLEDKHREFVVEAAGRIQARQF